MKTNKKIYYGGTIKNNKKFAEMEKTIKEYQGGCGYLLSGYYEKILNCSDLINELDELNKNYLKCRIIEINENKECFKLVYFNNKTFKKFNIYLIIKNNNQFIISNYELSKGE